MRWGNELAWQVLTFLLMLLLALIIGFVIAHDVIHRMPLFGADPPTAPVTEGPGMLYTLLDIADKIASVAAAIIAIVTLPRIVYELTARPSLTIGSHARQINDTLRIAEGDQYYVEAVFSEPGGESNWITLPVFIYNSGNKSSRDIEFNFTFDPSVEVYFEEGTLNTALLKEDHQIVLNISFPYIHPSDLAILAVRIRVSRGVDRFSFVADISQLDAKPYKKTLYVNISS